MAPVASELEESALRSWQLLAQFRKRLKPHLEATPKTPTQEDPRRELLADDYFCLLLFGLFNPALKSMRALCHVSGRFEKMRQICSRPVAAASFSEAQHVFDPEILAAVLRQLAVEAKGRTQFGDERVRQAVRALTIVAGTVLRTLNRMAWAPLVVAAAPSSCTCIFRCSIKCPRTGPLLRARSVSAKRGSARPGPGVFYVADRLYSGDHRLLARMQEQKIDFVLRLAGKVLRDPVEAARPLTPADDRGRGGFGPAGAAGPAGCRPVVRVVEIQAEGKTFVLVTSREDLPAEIIGLIYRYRWQIELFFKWFKTILGQRPWLAESPRGVAITLYSALIATLLLILLTGKRPTRRQLEAIHLYFVGFATEDELLRELGLQKS